MNNRGSARILVLGFHQWPMHIHVLTRSLPLSCMLSSSSSLCWWLALSLASYEPSPPFTHIDRHTYTHVHSVECASCRILYIPRLLLTIYQSRNPSSSCDCHLVIVRIHWGWKKYLKRKKKNFFFNIFRNKIRLYTKWSII